MNDFFYEQILPVKADLKRHLLRILVLVITVLLFIFLLLVGGLLSVTLCLLLVYLVFFLLLPKFNLEYEYALTNSHLEISAIYNKESRKEKYALDLHTVELIAPVQSPRLNAYGKAYTRAFVSTDKSLQAYSIILKKDNAIHNIIIQPDDTMKDSFKRRVPSRMFFD